MKYRKTKIFNGSVFEVPEHIQRLDDGAMHGWQLRYGEWKLFSDHSNDGSGARTSLAKAIKELKRRIKSLPAPTGLRQETHSNKNSKLPVGISGPIERLRKGRNVIQYYFGVTIPRFGDTPTNSSVYIGTENTMTKEKREAALSKAIAKRREAERIYEAEKTKAKRASLRIREKSR